MHTKFFFEQRSRCYYALNNDFFSIWVFLLGPYRRGREKTILIPLYHFHMIPDVVIFISLLFMILLLLIFCFKLKKSRNHKLFFYCPFLWVSYIVEYDLTVIDFLFQVKKNPVTTNYFFIVLFCS